MNATTIIVLIIIGLIVYAIYDMRKKKPENGQANEKQRQNGDQSGSQIGGKRRRKGGYGKWIGGGLGWAFGGPIGAIIGFSLGSMFEGVGSGQFAYKGTPRGDFAMSLLVLSAAVMKADQKVLRSELEYVKSFFYRQFGETEGTRLILMLKEILAQNINVPEVSQQIGQFMDDSSKLQLVHFLFGIAAADGHYHPEEVAVIEQACGYMGVSHADYLSIHAMFVKDPHWAYDVLEITKDATDAEVKKSYRDLAKRHHPDKVAHLGEDIKKAATEKFQKINAAYEEIKKKRGIS
ncbi:MAG: TerB family tellurite resistance protein [Bacteroidales bacterium]|nr:TerB family tellurite resistance protein [Bacteroidales bacterium]